MGFPSRFQCFQVFGSVRVLAIVFCIWDFYGASSDFLVLGTVLIVWFWGKALNTLQTHHPPLSDTFNTPTQKKPSKTPPNILQHYKSPINKTNPMTPMNFPTTLNNLTRIYLLISVCFLS